MQLNAFDCTSQYEALGLPDPRFYPKLIKQVKQETILVLILHGYFGLKRIAVINKFINCSEFYLKIEQAEFNRAEMFSVKNCFERKPNNRKQAISFFSVLYPQ